MNKKLLVFALLFASILVSSVFVSGSIGTLNSCLEEVSGEEGGVGCWLDNWLWDDDKDGNVILELRLINRYQYPLKNITLDLEKCSGEIKIDIIKSGEYWENESVLIKTDDVCIYDYYNVWGDKYFRSNSSFSYFDKDNIQKSYEEEFMFYVSEVSRSDYEKQAEYFRKYGWINAFWDSELIFHFFIPTLLITSFIAFLIIFVHWKLHKKEEDSFLYIKEGVYGYLISFVYFIFTVILFLMPINNQFFFFGIFVFIILGLIIEFMLYKKTGKMRWKYALIFSIIFLISSIIIQYLDSILYPEEQY